ncbi:hypothetical protein [Aporhodopirellula aestuarii]|uniref:Uncharacterized protein n=1 Tax=Aporhodopirellula aestuarii TaxID=2950107 RepID=A0ABT0UCT1_9BACT|nr:hypothetical protein [Aporhodopirellula aestuarii]MCM2374839.1 hypothetical protein [Aporhodopirellula aestuarii]
MSPELPKPSNIEVIRQSVLFSVFVFGVFTCTALTSGGSASAQGYSMGGLQGGGVSKPEFDPLPPSLSPYLDLLRSDSGVVSPYHSFVLPKRRIAEQQTQQSAQLRHLRSQVDQLNTVSQNRSRVSRDRVPTGRGGYFQQYSHFYPASNNASRR